MTVTTRERNMRRILLIFALVCFLLAGYLFIEARQLEQQVQALTAASRAVQQNPQPVMKQLRRAWPAAWAALGAGILLVASALITGRRKGATRA